MSEYFKIADRRGQRSEEESEQTSEFAPADFVHTPLTEDQAVEIAKAIIAKPAPVTFTPLYDRILVRKQSREALTISGLIIPDTAKETMLQGEVLAVGEGYVDELGSVRPLRTVAGDKILFGRYAGSKIELNGEDLLVMREAEVFGKVL